MSKRRHTVTFYEREAPYYASTGDGWEPPAGVALRLYESIECIREEAALELNSADVGLMTSYCPDGPAISRLLLDSDAAVRAFYDLDTPVTLDALRAGLPVAYFACRGSFGV